MNTEASLLKAVYLGEPQPEYDRTQSGRISKKQILQLQALGIQPKPGEYYHRGMVTASTASGTLQIVTTHIRFLERLKNLVENQDSWLQSLILQLRDERQSDNPNIQTLKHQYQMLGLYMLPEYILMVISDPPVFVQNCCESLGRLTEFYINGNYPRYVAEATANSRKDI